MRRMQLDVTFALIQQIAWPLPWPSRVRDRRARGELDKFSILRERFGLQLAIAGPNDVALAPFITIDHETPSTAIGSVVRSIIFPRPSSSLPPLVAAARAHRYSFAGLLTDTRRALLEAGSTAAMPDCRGAAAKTSLGSFLRRQLIRWRGADRQRRIGDVTVWSSEARPRFRPRPDRTTSVCSRLGVRAVPDGDYHWSYRFFEACLCGAVPIVEEVSPLTRASATG